MPQPPIYSDNLISITETDITFRNYYLPFFRKKVVRIDEIEKIAVEEPSLLTGKWRLHGTGDFWTWFPMDVRRPTRDRIFIVTLKNGRFRIGFTAEDGARVEEIFRSRGLIGEV